MNQPLNPKFDISFERVSRLSPEQIWRGWTHPATLMQWFCPRPWRVTDCRVDLRPGGEFFTVMEGPAGERVENHGCFLEVVPNQRLTWTNMMSKDYRPESIGHPGFGFVATILLGKAGGQTSYRAVVKHAEEAGRKQHEAMGFEQGWGMAFQQLEELFLS
ncbi:MAG: SRPBCC family protein [Bdellovibrionales bacterium]|nr:SRPBCC family protein [Bdellovibrionales bacterium]